MPQRYKLRLSQPPILNKMMKLFKSIFIALLCVLSSCSSSKTSLSYFEDLKQYEEGSMVSGDYNVKIIPDDELFITVTSMVPEATAGYNMPLSNPATRGNLQTYTQAVQQTYIVNKQGDIKFPILGTIHVEGMTTIELADYLTKKIGEDVEDPFVRVELINFRVNVMGEVTRPGAKSVSRERYSVLDALADAGDLTPYGERNNILLIREVDGKKEFHRMNLNDASILSSPYFYLQQNDVIYVEPNQIRKDNAEYNTNNAYKVSVASAIVSACSVVASLIIALVIK